MEGRVVVVRKFVRGILSAGKLSILLGGGYTRDIILPTFEQKG